MGAVHEEPDDAALRELLEGTRTIAVLGIKAGERDDAYRVPRYLQGCGYRIVPVNPNLERVLGERAYARLGEVPGALDLVDVFRAAEHLPAHAEEILALDPPPRAIWLQLGIRHDAVAAHLRRAGIRVVQDRCLMVEHRRLLDPGGSAR